MKRAALFLAATLTLFPLAAQTPEQTGGVYYAYPAPDTVRLHTAPKGYKAFYISHYGRHGSRWMPDEKRYNDILACFQDKQNLTARGKELRRKMKRVARNARGNAGELSPLGVRQQRGIALRMLSNYPEVFIPAAGIEARSSIVNRCRASMEAFSRTLKEKQPALQLSLSSDPAYMPCLSCDSPEIKALDGFRVPLNCDSSAFAKRLFKDPSRVGGLEYLMVQLHTAASDMQDVELPIDLFGFFTREEMLAIYDSNNRRMNFVNGDIVENEGRAARSGIPLWEDMVRQADSCLVLDHPSASLRFGHDTGLLRLLSFLRMERSYGMDGVVPMSANLQLIFYRGEGPVLVKFLLNEHEARIPLATETWPFYEWREVKDYYSKRAERLGHLKQLCALNTMVGTDFSTLPHAGRFGKGSEEKGQTIPAVLAPNGQTFWTPQTRPGEEKCSAPFQYSDTLFQGIRASHWLTGGCAQDYGSFTIAFEGGEARLDPGSRSTPFSHDKEISHPHYYSVELPAEKLRVELSGSSHCAVFRITPLEDGPIHVVLDPNSDRGDATVRIDGRYIYGENPVYKIYQKWGEAAGFSGHIVLRCEEEPISSGVSDGIAWASFQGKKAVPLSFTAATSFTGEKGAVANMKAESGDFEQTAGRLAELWCERLHKIDLESGDEAAIKQFYGALYRASFLPREMSDCDGGHPRFNHGRPMAGKGKRYGDFSLWDTYRALHPLLTIIEPTLSGELVQSLTDMYTQGGWMPVFPCWNSYTAAMIGDHAASVIAEAYVKGIRNFNIKEAYQGLRKNAFACPATAGEYEAGKGRRAVESYWKYGYIPLEDPVSEAFHKQEQVSRTLEYAYDDYALSKLAAELGGEQDFKRLLERAQNWRNVFDTTVFRVNGRYADGSFLPPGDQGKRVSWITEGAPCHYSWYVPHDVPGLIEAMGGQESFCARLDSLFDAGLYWHGNEPCHQIAYLYSLAGKPEKTRQRVKEIMSAEYSDSPGGLSGNEDAGQMSAWYIFSALGFYPVNPASGEYVTGSPHFDKATLNLENGRTFTIIVDDSAPERILLKHSDIVKGGRIFLKTR